MPTRALIFAFDGVLADTTNVQIAAWQRTFRAMGWNESDENCARAATLADRDFVAEVFARRKIEGGDLAGWAARKQALALQLLRDRPLLQPGAAALVHALKEAGVALGVVTPTPTAQVEAVLAASGLLDAFDLVVAGDGTDARPDPTAYRNFIEALGAGRGEAAALARSAEEAAAAEQAGLRTVVVATGLGVAPAPGGATPSVVLTDLAATLATLGV